jgi:large subunit ribosomal protein L21
MYAVIKTGGKQYRVEQGTTLAIERLDGDPGAPVTFDEVLLIGSESETRLGRPTIDGASVTGTIVEQGRAKKIIVFKFRRRKNYKRKKGHRQYFTRVRIDAIAA